jgi:hypothetical protein
MKSLNPSELGVVDRFALRADSSSAVAWSVAESEAGAGGAVVVEVSVECAMPPILAPRRERELRVSRPE